MSTFPRVPCLMCRPPFRRLDARLAKRDAEIARLRDAVRRAMMELSTATDAHAILRSALEEK